MAKQKINSLQQLGGLVYSTNKELSLTNNEPEENEPVAPEKQDLRVWLETKHRGGKAASIVAGFRGPQAEMEELGKKLKTHCGTGGSVKDGEIIIQGDHREKLLVWLLKNGFKKTKKAGG